MKCFDWGCKRKCFSNLAKNLPWKIISRKIRTKLLKKFLLLKFCIINFYDTTLLRSRQSALISCLKS